MCSCPVLTTQSMWKLLRAAINCWFIDASSLIGGRREPKVNIRFPVAEEGLTTDSLTAGVVADSVF